MRTATPLILCLILICFPQEFDLGLPLESKEVQISHYSCSLYLGGPSTPSLGWENSAEVIPLIFVKEWWVHFFVGDRLLFQVIPALPVATLNNTFGSATQKTVLTGSRTFAPSNRCNGFSRPLRCDVTNVKSGLSVPCFSSVDDQALFHQALPALPVANPNSSCGIPTQTLSSISTRSCTFASGNQGNGLMTSKINPCPLRRDITMVDNNVESAICYFCLRPHTSNTSRGPELGDSTNCPSPPANALESATLALSIAILAVITKKFRSGIRTRRAIAIAALLILTRCHTTLRPPRYPLNNLPHCQSSCKKNKKHKHKNPHCCQMSYVRLPSKWALLILFLILHAHGAEAMQAAANTPAPSIALTVLALNIGGALISKRYSVQRFIWKYRPAALFIFESEVTTEALDKYPSFVTAFKGYSFHYIPAKWSARKASRGEVLLINENVAHCQVRKLLIVKKHSCLSLHLHIDGVEHVICGIHGLHGTARNLYWEQVGRLARDLQAEDKRVTLMGDINVVDKPRLDRARGSAQAEVQSYSTMLAEAVLVDTWRSQNPDKREYTFLRDAANKETQRSRIDAVLQDSITASESPPIEILPMTAFAPDHRPIRATFQGQITLPPPEPEVQSRPRVDQRSFKRSGRCQVYQAATDAFLVSTNPNTWPGIKECMKSAVTSPGSVGLKTYQAFVPRDETSQMAKELATKIKHINRALIERKDENWDKPTRTMLKVECLCEIARGAAEADWYTKLRTLKKNLGRKLSHTLRTEKAELISARVEHILKAEEKNPRLFFQKANPEKAKRQETITAVRSDRETVTGAAVGPALRNYWSKIYSNNERLPTWEELPWLKENAAQYRQKFNWRCNAIRLEQAFTLDELTDALQRSKDGKAAYDLPVECLKYAGVKTKAELLRVMNEAYLNAAVPEEWSQSLIRLIYKTGDRLDCGNYRPITIADAAYRILMKMLTIRINALLVECDILAEEQGGFRKGRACNDKAMLLREMIRAANSRGDKTYILFVDIKKCFDRVNHSLIERTLEAMGFPERLRNFLAKIYRENTAEILLGGDSRTDPFRVEIGVKQGCPLSPTILNLVLDPIIRNSNMSANILGYVDDLSMISHDKDIFIRETKRLVELLHMAGFELGLDATAKSKTAVMTNCHQLQQFMIDLLDAKGLPVKYHIPILRDSESYKYLGTHININLTWEKQTQLVSSRVQYFAQLLRNKCFPCIQTVRIINQVIIPSITAKLSVAEASREQLSTWDRILAGVVNGKLGMRWGETAKYLHLDCEHGGMGLCSTLIEVAAARNDSLVYNGVLSNDPLTREAYAKQGAQHTLNTDVANTFALVPTLHTSRKTAPALQTALARDLGYITAECDDDELDFDVAEVIRCWSPHLQPALHAQVSHNGNLLPILEYLATKKLPKQLHNYKAMVFGDGSKTDREDATYGVYCTGGETFSGGVIGTKDVDRAELLACIHAALIGLRYVEAEVYTDSSYTEAAWNRVVAASNKAANPDLILLMQEIRREAKQAGRKITVHKVYSHVDDHVDWSERERRLNWMIGKYPVNYDDLVAGNSHADKLARQGYKGTTYKLPPFLTTKDTVYLGTPQQRLVDVRAYMRGGYQEFLRHEIGQKLTCFKWMRTQKAPLADQRRSNLIMCQRSYKMAALFGFTMRMRRKNLRENGPLMEKINVPFFTSRYKKLPTNDKCPLCDEAERRGHVMTACPATKHIRDSAGQKIKVIVDKHSRSNSPPLPRWWDSDEINYWGTFKAKWGSMGIIPAYLASWFGQKIGIYDRDKLDLLIGEIQVEILSASREAWNFRRKQS